MEIHKIIKETMEEHGRKVELIQWAIISSISSLIYSEYLLNMKQRLKPRRLILVPKISEVQSILDPKGYLIQTLSNKLIDGMKNHTLVKEYKDSPELILFEDKNVDVLKTIFDLYMIPNISRRIPETISKKFDLNNSQQQLFIEDKSIDMFNRLELNDDHIKYIIDEAVLQLLILMPTMKKTVDCPERNTDIDMLEDEILIVNNENAICPIIFNTDIYKNKTIMPILSFTTNTTVSDVDWQIKSIVKNGGCVSREATSAVFNEVSIVRLDGTEQIIGLEDIGTEA